MTRCLSLFLAMNSSESDLKQEMMVEEMEDLMEDQVWDGRTRSGMGLKFLHALRRSDSAEIALAKLRALIRRSEMRTEREDGQVHQ